MKATPTSQQLLSQIGNAKTIVFVGGISPRLEGEEMKVNEPGFKGGDRTDIELPQVQRDLLHMLHQAGKKIVFVNCSGGAMALVPELQSCDAIVQGWYPGEQGGQAIAEVLTGQVNPSGKLPLTFYRSVNDLPDFLDYTMKNRTYRYFKGETLFPFGYGRSYSSFAVSPVMLSTSEVTGVYDPCDRETVLLTASAEVENTSAVPGVVTVQLYIRDNTASLARLVRELRGFSRVELQPGEKRTASFDVTPSMLSFVGMEGRYVLEPGRFTVWIGEDSETENKREFVLSE
jgi:beta-glucosidase